MILAFLLTAMSCGELEPWTRGPDREPPTPAPSGKAPGGPGEISGVEGQNYRSGEVLVKFKPHVSPGRIEELAANSGLKMVRPVSPPDLFLMKIMGSSNVKETIQSLKGFAEVEYAEPNYFMRTKGKRGAQ